MLRPRRPLLSSLFFAGLLALAPACSDDTDPAVDAGTTPDQTVTPDLARLEASAPDASGDASPSDAGADISRADQVKAQTITFIKTLAQKLGAADTGKKVEVYVPADNEATGWVESSTTGKPGVEAGYDKTAIEAIINGSHDPYDKEGCDGFAKQDYTQGKASLTLFLWQMKSQSSAQKMVSDNKAKGEKDDGLTFESVSGVADRAILADDQPQWRAYGSTGVYTYKILANYMF